MSLYNVLLVDDEEAFVDAIKKRLEKRDLKINFVYNGYDALKYLSQDNQIEVVILDVKMPGIDGIETLKEIKTKFPLIEVIMLTGHATVETAIEGMKKGAYDYLMKPCDIEILVKKVSEASKKKSSHEEKIMNARMKEITGRMA